jgi:hypothetical protein
MDICVIDAELINKSAHRFPNLAIMKISGYHKDLGDTVTLKLDYNNLNSYDIVYISKVFLDTEVPSDVLYLPNVIYGGTGFFYDQAESLPYDIEHHMPDYHLYDDWVQNTMLLKIKDTETRKQRSLTGKEITKIGREFEYYKHYSIGFMTRKCFRGCEFCVNKNYKRVELHSPLEEFLDTTRKYICLLDDNVLGYSGWKDIIIQLQTTKKPFQFKQGLDERLLTEEKVKMLAESKYRGDYIFAFDNIEDKDIISTKLKLWRKHCSKTTKFYVLCGFDKTGKYDDEFWIQDIINTFERIRILMEYGCLPYIMRFDKYKASQFKGTYINLSRWCNQPNFFKKMSYREFCIAHGDTSSCVRYMNEYTRSCPFDTTKYYDMKFEHITKAYL